jgi:hypothetical protein
MLLIYLQVQALQQWMQQSRLHSSRWSQTRCLLLSGWQPCLGKARRRGWLQPLSISWDVQPEVGDGHANMLRLCSASWLPWCMWFSMLVWVHGAACEGSWRERCCAAVCQALHDSGPSLLQSGLSAELIAGGGHLVAAVQVPPGFSAASCACTVQVDNIKGKGFL